MASRSAALPWLVLSFLATAAPATPAAAQVLPFKQGPIKEALEHVTIPQEVPNGLTVRYRIGRGGPFVVAKDLNGQFSRVEELRTVLADEGNPLERLAATRELGRYRGDRSLFALIDSLRDINPRVREQAAVELGNTSDPRAVKPLIEMLGYSTPVVSAVVARSLEKLTGVTGNGAGLEAWENWYEAFKRWPHGVNAGDRAK